MAMSEEAKTRLRAASEKKDAEMAGRKTLKGLDYSLAMAAMDRVAEMMEDGPLPEAHINRHGVLWVREKDKDAVAAVERPDFTAIHTIKAVKGEKSDSNWSVLRYEPDWLMPAFAKVFPGVRRLVETRKYTGPDRPVEYETKVTLPLPILVAWFRFIWPKHKEWGERTRKYLVGVTTKYANTYPGVGTHLAIWKGKDYIGKGQVVRWWRTDYRAEQFELLMDDGQRHVAGVDTVYAWQIQ